MSFYKMERGWQESEIFGTSVYSERDAWSWLISAATWENEARPIAINGKPISLKRGEFSHSLRFMSKKFGWSKSKTERFIKKLCDWNMIKICSKIGTASGTGQNIISICNYSKYQDIKNKNELIAGQERDRSGTGAGQERDKDKELKEVKEGKEKKESIIYPQEFLDIWEVYPKLRRGGKPQGLKAFEKALTRDNIENINLGVQAYINSDEAKGQYAKGFAAWFNDDRWKNNYSQQKGNYNNGKTKSQLADEAVARGLAQVLEPYNERDKYPQDANCLPCSPEF